MEGMRENKKEKKTLKVTEYPALKKKKRESYPMIPFISDSGKYQL